MILDIIGYLLAYRRQCPVAYRLFAAGLVELFPRLNAAKSRSVTLVPVTGRSRAGARREITPDLLSQSVESGGGGSGESARFGPSEGNGGWGVFLFYWLAM
jgi:hypothetical protein